MSRNRTSLAAIVALGVVLAGCGDDDAEPATGDDPGATTEPGAEATEPLDDGIGEDAAPAVGQSAGSATVEVGGEVYEFSLEVCEIRPDAELGGGEQRVDLSGRADGGARLDARSYDNGGLWDDSMSVTQGTGSDPDDLRLTATYGPAGPEESDFYEFDGQTVVGEPAFYGTGQDGPVIGTFQATCD